jgi:hypothetical protein
LERPALLFEPDAAPFSGNRWKFWGAGPLYEGLPDAVPADVGEDDEPALPPDVPPLSSLDDTVSDVVDELDDDGAPTPLAVLVVAPLVWEAGEALDDAPRVPPPFGALCSEGEFGREAPPPSTAPPFLDPLPAEPAAELGFSPEGPDGGFPALAPAAALDDDAILEAVPAAAAPAPAIPAAATPAAPPTAKPPTASAPAPRAGPPETRAAARLGANSDNIARMIAAVRIVIAS